MSKKSCTFAASKKIVMSEYRRYAFISYSHRDHAVAAWLHRRLEGYRLPNSIHNEFSDSRYLRPVFRDQEDLNTGVLQDALKEQLLSSRYLIVICSAASARSEWVNREVETFLRAGRNADIIPLITANSEGATASVEEILPKALQTYQTEHPERELLAVNIAEVGREKALVRIVSRMLDVDFDVLWQRQKRRRRRFFEALTAAAFVLAILFYWLAIPVRLSVTPAFQDAAAETLPAWNEAAVEIAGGAYPMADMDDIVDLGSVGGYRRGRTLPLVFRADRNFVTIDTLIRIGWGMQQTIALPLRRDDSYALFAGYVYEASDDYEDYPLAGVEVQIGDRKTETDSEGAYVLRFPLEEQTETKPLRLLKDGYRTIEREEESPSTNAVFLMKK